MPALTDTEIEALLADFNRWLNSPDGARVMRARKRWREAKDRQSKALWRALGHR